MIVDHADDTNFARRIHDSTSPVRGVHLFPLDVDGSSSVNTRRDKVDVSWLVILATVSNGCFYQRGTARAAEARRRLLRRVDLETMVG